MQKEKEKEKEGRDKEMSSKEESLPPGFRFHPTDEELITCYLINKISDSSFSARAITDVDLNKCEPWELPGKAKMGEKEWYFFSMRDRKYPTGVRTNRATNTGYWKTTGKDKEILSSSVTSSPSELVGMKKTLVFYKGRAPRGEKSNWVMHEYRIHSKSSFFTTPNNKDEWVVCRVFQKSGGAKKYPSSSSSNHTRSGAVVNVVNPYSFEIGATLVGPPIMPDPNNSSHFQLYGRNFMNMNMNMSSADLADFSRVFRAPTPPSTSPGINLPMQHLNYHAPPPAFTVSGLNLNLAGAGMEATTQPLYRPINNPHHHVGSNSNIMPAADNLLGYVTTAEMSNPNINIAPTNRFNNNNNNMAIDHCLDFDHYWPSY